MNLPPIYAAALKRATEAFVLSFLATLVIVTQVLQQSLLNADGSLNVKTAIAAAGVALITGTLKGLAQFFEILHDAVSTPQPVVATVFHGDPMTAVGSTLPTSTPEAIASTSPPASS